MEKKRKGCSEKLCSYYPDDRISLLPDDVLLLVLSSTSMTLKDVVVTSLLSRRWRYVWASIPRLHFDHFVLCDRLNEMEPHERISEFSKRVMKMIQCYKGQNIEEFRLHCSLAKHHTHFVDWCIEFALSKNVQKLDMDFSMILGMWFIMDRMYDFQVGETNIGPSLLCWSFTGFKSLKSICFTFIAMGGDVLEDLLSNCPALEMLTLCKVMSLSYVKVVGPSLRLKHLEMIKCLDLKEIEIHDAPLVSLKRWWCGNDAIRISKVPHLVELSVTSCLMLVDEFPLFSSSLSQLESLKIIFFLIHEPLNRDALCLVSRLTKLRELELMCQIPEDLPLLAPFLKAPPHLQKIVIQVIAIDSKDEGSRSMELKEVDEVRVGVLEHLKVLEFKGYSGKAIEDKFIEYVIKNAAALETIIITNPHFRNELDFPDDVRVGEEYARRRAKERLEEIVPSTVKLFI